MKCKVLLTFFIVALPLTPVFFNAEANVNNGFRDNNNIFLQTVVEDSYSIKFRPRHSSAFDKDNNKIFDSLDGEIKISKGNVSKEVIMLFSRPVQTSEEIMINNLGGRVKSVFRYAVHAIYAELPISSIQAASKLIDLVQIEDNERKFYLSLNVSTVQIRARPYVWNLGYNGSGQVIAVLDTGIDSNHPDVGPYGELDWSKKIIGWHDFLGLSPLKPVDEHGHGTHCASIAAGTGQASNGTFIGVAPAAKLVGVRIFKTFPGFTAFTLPALVLEGIEWVIQNKEKYGITVASMSFGDATNCDGNCAICQAVDNMALNGIVPVVAAGNNGNNGDNTVGTPACAKYAVTVGATYHDQLQSWSSKGPTADGRKKPDVVAPGVAIIAARAKGTDMDGGAEVIDEFYVKASGTSMATPHVAGLAALIRQANFNLTSLEVKNILCLSAFETGSTTYDFGDQDNMEGFGRVCADAAIEAITNYYQHGSMDSDYLGAEAEDKKVWCRRVYLEEGETYNLTLEVPNEADYDLYLYSIHYDEYGQPMILTKSCNGSGQIETILVNPANSSDYIIAVKWRSGSGMFTIPEYSFTMVLVLLVVTALLAVILGRTVRKILIQKSQLTNMKENMNYEK